MSDALKVVLFAYGPLILLIVVGLWIAFSVTPEHDPERCLHEDFEVVTSWGTTSGRNYSSWKRGQCPSCEGWYELHERRWTTKHAMGLPHEHASTSWKPLVATIVADLRRQRAATRPS